MIGIYIRSVAPQGYPIWSIVGAGALTCPSSCVEYLRNPCWKKDGCFQRHFHICPEQGLVELMADVIEGVLCSTFTFTHQACIMQTLALALTIQKWHPWELNSAPPLFFNGPARLSHRENLSTCSWTPERRPLWEMMTDDGNKIPRRFFTLSVTWKIQFRNLKTKFTLQSF